MPTPTRNIRVLMCCPPDMAGHVERSLAGAEGIEIVNGNVDLEQLVGSVTRMEPDAVVIGAGSDQSYLEELKRTSASARSPAVLICAGVVSAAAVYAALAAGARGYVSQAGGGAALREAVRAVAMGNIAFGPDVRAVLSGR